MGVAGCSYRHDFNLKKQRQDIVLLRLRSKVIVQVGEAKPFKDIHVVFYLEGPMKKKAARAAQLSFEKYCSFL
jgi:putative redox protein